MNAIIQSLLESLNYPVSYLIDSSGADQYFVFNYADDRGDAFADDVPTENVYSIQIHFLAPMSFDHTDFKKQVRMALLSAGFTYPTIQTFIETVTKKVHIVFECEYSESQEV